MKIRHEHIRMAMNAWAHPDGEKVPASAQKLEELLASMVKDEVDRNDGIY
ncbi:hypothetical protein B9R23_001932 [Escherichia coli]|nr:hypothetical protein [Escherichia coli]EFF2374361.1 hypothetical protein [Escherichia coli]EFF2389457.1 hypothetical protein [Escherichia coli]